MGNESSNPRDRAPVRNWVSGASTAQQRQAPPMRQPPGQRQTTAQRDSKLEDIKRNVRALLATEKKGLDPMRFVNNYQELTNESFFDAIATVGYRTVTDFCNDNLDCIDYDTWDYGARAVFHGIPDAKSAHIFQMNQATRSKNAPNFKPIPARFQPKFGNFIMPMHKVAEREKKLAGALDIPDKHRRRIIAVLENSPEGLTTEEVKLIYSEMYEEPFPMTHLASLTQENRLDRILEKIDRVKTINGKWVALSNTLAPVARPEPAPLIPRDISKSPEFEKLKREVIAALQSTPDYTMTLNGLQKTVKIDLVLFGKSSAAELLTLITEIKVRQDLKSWIVHLRHKGIELPYKIKSGIYNTLNSDPNGLLLGEFGTAFQRITGRNLVSSDYEFKSLWHLLHNHPDICSMIDTKDGLLLVAEKRPEPPAGTHSHPPGFPARAAASVSHVTPHVTSQVVRDAASLSSTAAVTTPRVQPVSTFSGCPPIGQAEISLTYKDFKEDDNYVVVNISCIYSPTEFYVTTKDDNTMRKNEFKNLASQIKSFYDNSAKRASHRVTRQLITGDLLIFSDEYNVFHRVVVEETRFDSATVRSLDTGKKYEALIISLYEFHSDFRVPCFARRCALSGIRPFEGNTWDPRCLAIFGPKQHTKTYFAELSHSSNTVCELDIVDTYTEEDRRFRDILVAEGLAETTTDPASVSGPNNVPNNAPATPNDSLVVEEDEEEDDWLDTWLEDDELELPVLAHNDHIQLDITVPPPVMPAPAQPSNNLWERTPPIIDTSSQSAISASDFLLSLMQKGRAD